MNATAEEQTALVERSTAAPMALAPTGSDSQALMQMIGTLMARPDIDVDRLERLLMVKKAWEADEARKAFHDSMAAFKRIPTVIRKDNHVSYTKKDGSVTEYDHATLGNIVKQITEGLSSHGFSVSWNTERREQRIYVTCSLTHRLGHSESVTLDAAPDDSGGKNSIQAVGSAITYLQRYTLLAVTGLAVEGQDDDGRTAIAGAAINHLLDSLLARVEATTTDEQAAAVWKEGSKALSDLKDQDAYAEFKECVAKHRTMLKNKGVGK